MLTSEQRGELSTILRDQRKAVFATVAHVERDLAFIAEDRESELEERAQEERLARVAARLDDRGKLALEEIDAALRRIGDRRYGLCTSCHQPIPFARLRAVPAALHCIECADGSGELVVEATAETPPERPTSGLPADLGLLSDRELEQALWEEIGLDGRIDTQELRFACRKGTVHLRGSLPSEREHQELLRLLTDVMGIAAIDDRTAVNALSWEREDRSPVSTTGSPDVLAGTSLTIRECDGLPATTEDVAESNEKDFELVAPVRPVADEQ